MTRDIAADVAAILHPLPTPSPEEYAESPDVYDTWREDAAEEQQRLAEQLRRGTEDGEADPLLTALANEVAAKQDAEANIRRLLAYGREFVRPRGYTLESLAQACGMSFSGVRTAYDDREVGQVAEATGAKPRDDKVYVYNPLSAEAGAPSLRWSPRAAGTATSETPPEQDATGRG